MIPFRVIEKLKLFFGNHLEHNNLAIEFIDGKVLRLIATDGYMILVVDIDYNGLPVCEPVMVNKSFIKQITNDVHIQVFGSDVFFIGKNQTIIAPKESGKFPDHKRACEQTKGNDMLELDAKRLMIIGRTAFFFAPYVHIKTSKRDEALVIRFNGNGISAQIAAMPVAKQ